MRVGSRNLQVALVPYLRLKPVLPVASKATPDAWMKIISQAKAFGYHYFNFDASRMGIPEACHYWHRRILLLMHLENKVVA